MSASWKELKSALEQAQGLLCRSLGRYIGADPLGHFDINVQRKISRRRALGAVGSFDAWKDRISLNLDDDVLGTAVHELLHANAFSDDWTPADLGRAGDMVSFRGLEIQLVSPGGRRVRQILHRGINEAVTELLTLHVYPRAIPAYASLLPCARKLLRSLGFDDLARAYFWGGYPALDQMADAASLDLNLLDARSERILRGDHPKRGS